MYKKILIPVVFDEDHKTQSSFDVAQALASADAEIIVMHVQEVIPSYVSAEIPVGVTEKAQIAIKADLAKMTSAIPKARSVLGHGHPGRVIVQQAEAEGADCIIIASHRPGLEDYFLGSTAGRVVRHAKCAVHVIR